MAVRAVFYDLDGTLRMNVPNAWKSFCEYASELGLDIQPEDQLRAARWEHYYFAQSPELIADRMAYPDGSAFWQNYGFRQLLELGASNLQAAELAPKMHHYMDQRYRPDDVIPDDVFETLKTLKEKGYILGVLSNREESFWEYLGLRKLSEYFTLAIPAGEVGLYKPDPGVFHYLLEKAGISAEEAIYVGDNYYADVLGARQAGMSAVLLDVNRVFDTPDCPVIQSHREILSFLDGSSEWPGKEK